LKLEGASKVTGEGLTVNLPQLEMLDLNNCSEITSAGLNNLLSKSNQLTGLNIIGIELSFEDISANLPNLNVEVIDLDRSNVTDSGLNSLLRCFPKYQGKTLIMDLSSTPIIGEGIVASFDKLKGLSLTYCETLTDAGLENLLKSSPNLTYLDVSNTKITGTGIVSLGKVKVLLMTACKNLTSSGLNTMLENCKSLDFLQLRGTSLTDLSAPVDSLDKLDLSGDDNLTDADINTMLGMCKKLKYLLVKNCAGLTLQGITAPLDTLEEIDLKMCQNLTVAGLLRMLTGCKRLRSLDLMYTNIQMEEELATKLGQIENLDVPYEKFIVGED